MSTCRVFSCVVGRGCLLWPVHSLGRTLISLCLLYSVLQGQICLTPGISWLPGFAFQSPIMKLEHFLELTPKKDVLFILGDWNTKVGFQETPGVTGKFGLGVQNEAGQRPIEFCQENALVIANTLFQQPKTRLYTWTSPDGQHHNQTDYILCSWRWRNSIQSAKTRMGVDCGSDHELLIAKFRHKLKKVVKTTRPFKMT